MTLAYPDWAGSGVEREDGVAPIGPRARGWRGWGIRFDARGITDRRKFVARELGARAIRLNRFDNEPHQESKEHDELASGQEEMYIPVAGSGHIVVDGETVALNPGVFVLVAPDSTRQVVAGRDGRLCSTQPPSPEEA